MPDAAKRRLSLEQKKSLKGVLFISPWLVGVLLFFARPIALSITYSFNELRPTASGYVLDFLGLGNFQTALLKDAKFPRLLAGSLQGLILDVPIILVFSFFVALLLKENFRGVKAAKAFFFLPVILSSGIFMTLLSSGQSSNVQDTIQSVSQNVSVLQSVNIERYLLEAGLPADWIGYITGPIDRIYQVITCSGVQIFLFLASLSSIPPSLYEACKIEGASGWECFWKITFPMSLPIMLVNVIYSIIDSFTSMTNEIMTYTYDMAFTSMNFGLSSAMCWIYFAAVGLIMGVAALLMSRRIFYYN